MHNNEMETTEKLNYVPTFNNKMEDKEEWKMKMQAIQNDKNHREPCWNHPKTKHRKNTMTNKYNENSIEAGEKTKMDNMVTPEQQTMFLLWFVQMNTWNQATVKSEMSVIHIDVDVGIAEPHTKNKEEK